MDAEKLGGARWIVVMIAYPDLFKAGNSSSIYDMSACMFAPMSKQLESLCEDLSVSTPAMSIAVEHVM